MQVSFIMKYLILFMVWWNANPIIPVAAGSAPDHSAWQQLLQEFVNDKGDVAYARFKIRENELTRYMDYLADHAPAATWTRNETLAYYINLYNAATIALILEHYPTESIRDIWRPWGQNSVRVGDKTISLGDIEHKILRKMNEPRIHFAINCASFSCPKLRSEAYKADKLEAQLHAATVDFINDPTRNILSRNKLELSAIFKWYKIDFTGKNTLINYIQKYTKLRLAADAKITYLSYDWRLNESR
ncbi:MAG: DUF547 domain-containing protein [Arenibacter sp.]|nr:DUF547 domain-containing protein [Arenibacter sp.]